MAKYQLLVPNHGKSNRWIALYKKDSLVLLTTMLFSSVLLANDCTEESNAGEAVDCLQKKISLLEGKLQEQQIKKGVIMMWSGSMHGIPQGWALCDGKDGRPNLQDRFVLGAGAHYPIGEIGGASSHSHKTKTQDHSLTAAQLPRHSHKMGYGGADSTTMVVEGAHQRLAHFKDDKYNAGPPKTTHTDGGSGQGHFHSINPDEHNRRIMLLHSLSNCNLF